MNRFMPFSLIMAICLSCNSPKSPQQTSGTHADTTKTNAAHAPKSRTALRLDSLGYQNIAEQDSTIIVDLMYAKPDNFTGKILYADLREGYLHPDAMKCLLKAQQILRKQHPEYRLIVYDAARPMSVQQEMWDEVKGAERSVALVTDVFTRNVNGCGKNGILHEATGTANTIYVLVDIAGQTYLTRGATYSYYEFVRPLGERLTDEEWQQMLKDRKAPDVPSWMRPYLLEQAPEVDEHYFYSSGC